MTRKDFSLILILLVIGIAIGLFIRGCGHTETTKTFPDEMDSILNLKRKEADSISYEVAVRDSILASMKGHTDTVITSTDRYVYLYRSSTDTVVKMMSCDSIVIGYENLKKDYYQNDSLHMLNEAGLKIAVGVLKTALDTAQVAYDAQVARNEVLEKKNRRLKRVAAVSSAIAVVASAGFILK